MPNVRVIPRHTEHAPTEAGDYDRFIPERLVFDNVRDPYFPIEASIQEIFDTIDMINDVCVHGMSASLCSDPTFHYPLELS